MTDPWSEFKPASAPKQSDPWAEFKAAPQNLAQRARDVVQSFRTGVLQGGAGTAGTVAEASPVPRILDAAVGAADNVENLFRAFTGQQQKQNAPFRSSNVPGLKTALAGAPATEDINRVVQRVAGRYRTPQTTAGRYAQSIGQMAPALLAPGSAAARVANTVIPGVAAQGAADVTKAFGGDEHAQELARMAGTIGGGLLANVRAPATADLPTLPERVLTPEQRNIQTLREAGVAMTPGQRMGGQAKNLEDLAARAPILGAAIKGARSRAVESLNRSVGHRALEPLGEGVPSDIHTGHDAVAYVGRRLGRAYDEAADMVPETQLDADFGRSVADIRATLTEQPETVSTQFDNILNNRISHLLGGPVSGRQVRQAQSDINRLAAEFSASDDGAQRALGNALNDVQTQLGDVIGRASPQAGELIGRANQGWSVYARMRNAASKAKGGVFTPGQLNTAVRTLDRSVGKGNVARGEAVLQDLSNAAWEVLPDSYGNPGTADALSAFGLAGAMVAPTTAPAAIPTGVGLTAAAVPYALMGRRQSAALPPVEPVQDPQQFQRLLQQIQGARVRVPDWLMGTDATVTRP